MKRKTKRYLIFLGVLTVIFGWIIFLNFFTPTEIIAKLGARNSYIILFLISAIGGTSLITASSYYIAISVLAIAGLNPAFLGLIGDLGVTIGDSIYFYLGLKGREFSPEEIGEKLKRVEKLLQKSPKWLIPFIVYIYSAFTIFPNDLMTFSLGISGYPFKRMFFPLLIGNITATIILSYLAIYGIDLFGFS